MVNKYNITLIIKDNKGKMVSLIDLQDCKMKLSQVANMKEMIYFLDLRFPENKHQRYVSED